MFNFPFIIFINNVIINKKEEIIMSKLIDLTGQKFGEWTVIKKD